MPIKYVFGIAVLAIVQLVVGLFMKSQLSSNDTISTPSAASIVELARYGNNDRLDRTLISADGSTLVRFDSPARLLRIIDTETSDTRTDISMTPTNGLIRLSPNGQYLSVAELDAVLIWDTDTNVEVGRIVEDFDAPIQDIIWSQDSSRILLTAQNGDYQAFNAENSDFIDINLGVNSNEILAIAWDNENSLTAIIIIDDSPRFISSDNRQFALDIDVPSDVSSIGLAPHDDLIVYGTDSGELGLVDVVTGERVKTFEGHTSNIISVQWSPDGKQFVSTDLDGLQIVWGIPVD